MRKFKDQALAFQIWVSIAIITLIISGLLLIVLPHTLRSFFTREIYKNIESAQNLLLWEYSAFYGGAFPPREASPKPEGLEEDMRIVNHILVLEDSYHLEVHLPEPVDKYYGWIESLGEEIKNQGEESKEYVGFLQGQRVFYIISKTDIMNGKLSIVSFLTDNYREDLVGTLFRKLLLVTILIFLFSWIPAILMSRYLSRPIGILEEKVDNLASRKWEEAIDLKRQDEIGKLGQSMEKLRLELIDQDLREQTFLQNVSHELKTPTMVIRSYIQAIRDGIYPREDLAGSLDIIDGEAERLEARIKSLLYLTKLDYLAHKESRLEDFDLAQLVLRVQEKFSYKREDLDWDLDLAPLILRGNLDQIQVVVENILDNMLRYSRSTIAIKIGQEPQAYLSFFNDGEPIEAGVLENIFQAYHKGYEGELGLGLAIVFRILNLHGYRISIKNVSRGVVFRIDFT